MHEFALAPYFHPTTICFVDDNESFLQSLDLELPGHWACRVFNDPENAMAYLETPVPLPPLMDRCFSIQSHSSTEALIKLDLNLIEQEINHADRFRRNSVVVVDYSMPSMNGLDFCARLSDPLIRKAMFTGVADEKVAVGAFNAGLIHRFIPKQATGAISVALGFIDDLQREYFSQYSARLKNTLSINPPGFLTEPAIARFVEALMEKEQLVEYYLVDEPPGLLLLKGNGRMYRFVALNQQQMDEQLSYAMRQGVPEDLASRMRANEVIGFFGGDAPEDYFGDEPYPWHENCRPAEAIQGRNERWFVAVLEDAAQDVDFDPATACYDAYLRSL